MIAFTVNSFAISMVHSMLSGTASMDFGGKRAGATAAGMFEHASLGRHDPSGFADWSAVG